MAVGDRVRADSTATRAARSGRTKPASRRKTPVPQRDRGRAHPISDVDPIITMDAAGVIQSASDSVEKVFGWTPAELCGQNVRILIPEPRRSALDRYLDRYRRGDSNGTLQRSRRFEAVRKSGRPVLIEMSVSRAELPSHRPAYFISILRDVSRQIDIGGDSPVELTRLHRVVAEQSRALANANLRLQLADRLAALGTLAAGLGHDMNNVLLPVQAKLNAIEHAEIPASAIQHVRAVRRSIAYLQHLSDGLHFLALDQDGTLSIQEEGQATDLAYWWSQVGVLLRRVVPARVRLRASFPAGLPRVRIAAHWITQAMLNLLVNAGEAIPASRRAAKIRIGATASEDGESVRIFVADNGRGMSQHVQRRAFDLFYTTKARGLGTGLGLPLVRKVASRAGGTVQLRSEPGKGTIVTLVLAAAPAMADGHQLPSATHPHALVSIRDHRIAGLLSQMLIATGLRVTVDERKRPDGSAVWLTPPSPAALAAATKWRRTSAEGTLIVLGMPSQRSSDRWEALDAKIIDPADDFVAIRHAIGLAAIKAKSGTGRERKRR